ncbi:sulfatase family protein [Aestuariibaculum suncheonense]|uniref:Arylsulfatase n=1 Tax=Aestuariibaculum suncheonense TaxID=1028745 RepID=A0A8J6UMF3_9FLAO|nr:arylsulfatase [Aestuariibaculum suncheonense]MBD0836881.1 arylsulfatase [Aestuariibaculum suncheonense]
MKITVLFISLFAILSFNSFKEIPKKTKRPNIIYVLADDLGYGDLSAYNKNSKIQTPHLDQMASEGMMFTDAHTSSSVCTPTRYGIITGRYNWRSPLKQGVLTGNSKALIPTERTTVASMLKQQGYHTAFIGKWHLGWDWALKDSNAEKKEGWDAKDFDNIDFSKPVQNGPKELGFDYSYGHSGSLDMAPYVYVENGMPTQVPDTVSVNDGKFSWWRKGPTASDFVHEDVTPNFFRKSFKHIEAQAKTDQPFFLYLALPSPHTPILPTEEWQGKSQLNPYGDFVMMVDDYMGQLVKAIKDAGIEDNTLVIFTSDNGCSPAADIKGLEAQGHYPSDQYRGHKADIFEGGHRVPFIVKWPDYIKKGTVSNDIICTTDFMATAADITNYSLLDNEGEDSYSMLPLFKKPNPKKPIREATVHHSINGSFAIRQGDWKLAMCAGSGGWSGPKPGDKEVIETLPEIQLYNLKNDPGETTNLQDRYPEKVTALKTLLIRYIKEGRSTPGTPQPNDAISFIWKQIDFVNP